MKITNWVVISDLHCGCQLGLCPPGGAKLDDGRIIRVSHYRLIKGKK